MPKKSCLSRLILLGPVVLFLAGLFLPPAAAMVAEPLSRYASDYGQKLFSEKKYDEALKHFIAAVSHDPANRTARDYLRRVHEIFPSDQDTSQRQALLRIVDMLDYIQFLNSRIEHLRENNALMWSFVREQGARVGIQQEELPLIQKMLSGDKMPVWGLEPSIQERIETLGYDETVRTLLYGKFQEYKGRLIEYLGYQQSVNDRLRAARSEIVAKLTSERQAQEALLTKGKVQQLTRQLSEKQYLVERQGEKLSSLEKELNQFQVQVSQWQQKIKETDEKIAEMTRNLAGMSLELYQRDKQVQDKDQKLVGLQDELREAQERLNLVQYIMQQKDKQIQNLEKEMMGLQANREALSPAAGTPEAVAQLSGDLADLQAQIDAQTKRYREDAQTLEEKFQGLLARYDAIEKQLKASNEEIQQLSYALKEKEGRIEGLQKIFVSKDQKVIELNGILEIYKWKLDETASRLREKSTVLNAIEEKLQSLEGLEPPEDESSPRPPSQSRALPPAEDPRVKVADDLGFWGTTEIRQSLNDHFQQFLGL